MKKSDNFADKHRYAQKDLEEMCKDTWKWQSQNIK